MKKFCLILLLFITSFDGLQAQKYKPAQLDFKLSGNGKKIEIPFTFENNFIIVTVLFNNFFPLKFIFDTGAEHTILTKREISDLMSINYTRRFTIMGSDMTSVLIAYLTQNIDLTIGKLKVLNKNILVLDEDYFRFDEYAGIDVHGIMGADLFRRYVVEINYKRRIITLYQPDDFEAPEKKFYTLPIEVSRNKPYINVPINYPNGTLLETKLLLDTGASLPVLLYTNTHSQLQLPEKIIRSKLAMGLGGELEGFIGRSQKVTIGEEYLRDVTTYFQELPKAADSLQLNDRDGILGNEILSRFTVIIDYMNSEIHLRPGRKFRKKFKYDRSGILLARAGEKLEQFVIYDIVKGSPADKAGLQIGDIITWCNGWPAIFYSLEGITNKFKKRIGKKIRLKVERDEVKMEFKFRLKDLI